MTSIFKSKNLATKQKLRGGYYTPKKIADYLSSWALRQKSERVLEPSCGDGNFVESIFEVANMQKVEVDLVAVEIDSEEIAKAKTRVVDKDVQWINEDFFRSYRELSREENKFDIVIGNPPFIRFQYFDDESREIAFDHLRAIGYKPTKLANSWAAFTQLSIDLLRDGGRLGMVIPAELLQVKYASELRERIVKHFDHVILVGFKKLVFPDIQQEVVLLLAEGKHSKEGSVCDVHTIQVESEADLDASILEEKIAHTEAKHTHPGMKWTSFFLPEDCFSVLDRLHQHEKLTQLGQLASVDVGIVTGRNNFFVLNEERIKEYDLIDYCTPMVGRTSAINNILFDKEMFDKAREKYSSFLLDLKGIEEQDFSSGLKEYIRLGEEEGVHTGYKCRVRKRWYEVPSIYISDGFLFRQIHKYPLLVSNVSEVACTDTIHRVRLLKDVSMEHLSASFVNSLTLAWSEVCGRSYGGGVLELETREAEELPIPFFEDIQLDVDLVNKYLSDGDIESALDYVDNILLVECLGFSTYEVKKLRESWYILRDRRLNRK
ncbi:MULTISPECIES: N-6 DNA methylase [Vibrio harveyi group]|uniref:N-6 DNA methylase n=1 Tax=Vibrio harveyi group TaxID=717610 RepID=UPI0015F49A3D|nr:MULTISPECIES: N-6 DNA methylase [Vibrio harveyi group]EJP3285165.1 SAM-dependent DNA methyltransferase [Vibrio parahaemolyticus]MDF4696184.1 N-6 DNA methylase [Vibrio parahaemolyticus]MDF5048289.1 N-6 DNA methylase [Vibrio parahaemolyticus]MDF5621944.1 N-6 DNA methylase [Vibrio parahaemolyticus]UPR11671.1 SAM-dependent DNA methyltransferase [Vibrio parahaemolyticus]